MPGSILVIDDELTVLEFMVAALHQNGYAAEGFGPVAGLARALHDPPALILLDMMMPALDGGALHAELRKHPGTAATPVIIVTAWHDPAAWFGSLVPAAILAKPFSLAELIEAVHAALGEGSTV